MNPEELRHLMAEVTAYEKRWRDSGTNVLLQARLVAEGQHLLERARSQLHQMRGDWRALVEALQHGLEQVEVVDEGLAQGDLSALANLDSILGLYVSISALRRRQVPPISPEVGPAATAPAPEATPLTTTADAPAPEAVPPAPAADSPAPEASLPAPAADAPAPEATPRTRTAGAPAPKAATGNRPPTRQEPTQEQFEKLMREVAGRTPLEREQRMVEAGAGAHGRHVAEHTHRKANVGPLRLPSPDTPRTTAEDSLVEPEASTLPDDEDGEPTDRSDDGAVCELNDPGVFEPGDPEGLSPDGPSDDLQVSEAQLAETPETPTIPPAMAPDPTLPSVQPEVLLSQTSRALLRSPVDPSRTWPAVCWLERNHPALTGALPPSPLLESHFLLEHYLSDGVPARRERLELLLQEVETSPTLTPQQAAMVVLTGGAAVLLAGTATVPWSAITLVSDGTGMVELIRGWQEVVTDLHRRLLAPNPGRSLLDLAVGHDASHRRKVLTDQADSIFDQLRQHRFPFVVGNRFLRAAFPSHGAGRLDFILVQLKAEKPDVERLRTWCQEFDTDEFMRDVLRQVRGPAGEDADLFSWGYRYVRDRLNALKQCVSSYLEVTDRQHSQGTEAITGPIFTLKKHLKLWQADLQPRSDDDWSVCRNWARESLGLVSTQLEEVMVEP